MYKLIHPTDLNNIVKETWEKCFKVPEMAYEMEYRIIHKEGHVVWVQEIIYDFHNSTDFIHFKGIMKDITLQRTLEKRLKTSEQSFQKAYQQEQFFKRIIAHDINNILGNIKASTELLKMHLQGKTPISTQKTEEICLIIREQIIRGNKLIKNVRNLSRLENRSLSLSRINLFPLLESAIDYINNTFQNQQISIEINSNKNKIYLLANNLLQDAFENILINAVKYNESPIVKIMIKISEITKKNKKYVKIQFIDNGIGIPDMFKKSIFKKGFKGKKGKGMGIGLTLVKHLIEHFHGKIYVKNKNQNDYSQGSNFTILLPKLEKRMKA
jgi:signal transduction histidine kinase